MSGPHIMPLHIAGTARGIYLCVGCRRVFRLPGALQAHLDEHPSCRRHAMRAAHGAGAGRRCAGCKHIFRNGDEMYLYSIEGVLSFVCRGCYQPAAKRAAQTEEVPY